MYINLPNYLFDLNENIKIYNFHAVLKRIHIKSKKTITCVAKELGVSQSTCSNYLSGKNKPNLKMLKKLGQFYNTNFLDFAFSGNYLFIIKRKKVKLPRKLTSELVYYIGYLQGDGYLESDNKSIGFTDEYKSQLEKIRLITIKVFGVDCKIYSVFSELAKKPCYHLTINSFIINSFIQTVFEINTGVKVNLKVPKIILNKKEFLPYYISGLYDADGTLPKRPKKAKQLFVDITMKDKEFIEEIQKILFLFEINTLKLFKRKGTGSFNTVNSFTWEIRIRKKSDILLFLKKIGFRHPDKIKRQKELIQLLINEPAGNRTRVLA